MPAVGMQQLGSARGAPCARPAARRAAMTPLLPAACPLRALGSQAARPRVAVASTSPDRDVTIKAADTIAAPLTDEEILANPPVDADRWRSMSYSQQYDELYQTKPLPIRKMVPKPSREAQAREPGAKPIIASDIYQKNKRPLWGGREWNTVDYYYTAFIGGMHLLCLAAPFTFSWSMVGLFFATYFVTGCLGITLSYHRQLSHKSFSTPKWVEYVLAYCGVLAVQGDPLEWVSSHRYHHLHTDTPLDPHSPYEGFWWSHAGWLLDNTATLERVYNRSNADDMESQWYYRWLRDTYPWHVVAQFVVLYLAGGFPAVVWGGALRMVWVWHVTWFVNSICHVWGDQTYNTGDLSTNNWLVGILAFGEGWHNNHHAFEFSARHGLEWWQFDMTWIMVKTLEALGLASNIKLPSERQKARLAFKPKPLTA